MTGRRRLAFALIAGFAGLAVLAAIGEVVLRLLPPDEHGRLRVRHPVYHHGLRPNAHLGTTWGDRPIQYWTNSLGMRDASNRDVPLTPSGQRVLFLGDSFTEGVGVDWGDTFVAKFSAMTGTEALNGGVVSFGTVIEYLRLKELFALGFTCDRVILMFDVSDVMDELLYHSIVRTDAVGEPRDFASLRNNRLGVWVYNNVHVARSLYLRATALTGRDAARERSGVSAPEVESPPTTTTTAPDAGRETHFYAARALWTEDEGARRRWADRGLVLARTDLGRIQELCAAHGVAFDLVIYPWPQQLAGGRVPSYAETAFEAFAAERGIRLVNLFPVFRAQADWRELYIDYDVHWNAAGHQLVAAALVAAATPAAPEPADSAPQP